MEKITAVTLRSLKGKKKITAITAYDYPSGWIAEKAGLDVILVGDSLGMVIKGEPTTLNVTVEEVAYHTRAVKAAVNRALLVADMPFLSYVNGEEAVKNAGILIRAGAEAVKIEGPRPEIVKELVKAEIPVMGHLGLTPQSYLRFGGFKVQGKEWRAALSLVKEALELEEAGVFSIVLESIPLQVAEEITRRVSVPTIGIGSGPQCDGQILVFHDLLGLYPGHTPKFVRKYASLAEAAVEALRRYAADVEKGGFPSQQESYFMKEEELKKFREELKDENN